MCDPFCAGSRVRCKHTVTKRLFEETGLGYVVGDVLTREVCETGCFARHVGDAEGGMVEGGGGVLEGGWWDVKDLVDLVAGSTYACTVDGDELKVLCRGGGEVVLT